MARAPVEPVQYPLHAVIDIIHEMSRLGHSDGFKKHLEDSNAFVTVHPDTIKAVQSYLADNDLHAESDIARKVVAGCGSDPHCNTRVTGD